MELPSVQVQVPFLSLSFAPIHTRLFPAWSSMCSWTFLLVTDARWPLFLWQARSASFHLICQLVTHKKHLPSKGSHSAGQEETQSVPPSLFPVQRERNGLNDYLFFIRWSCWVLPSTMIRHWAMRNMKIEDLIMFLWQCSNVSVTRELYLQLVLVLSSSWSSGKSGNKWNFEN